MCIRDSFTDEEIRAIQATPSPPSQTVARFRDLPLDFEPGSAWRYSNVGYILLGVIIEQASGQPYEAYLQENILDPLGMDDSGYDHNRDDLAVGYTAGFEKAQYIDMTFPLSAGALYSTVEDLYRWDQALVGEQLLPRPLLDAMQTPHARIPDSGSASYGYGWVVDSLAGHRSVGHSGGIDGYAANITRFPDDGLTVIVLSNQQTVNPGFISNQLAEIVLGQ
jgi:CubicO group peptidase (beta-lactamase class C family)